MTIKNIVVPTDFSETAQHALRWAAQFASICGAQLNLLHVYSLPVLTARGNPVLTDPEAAGQIESEAKRLMEFTLEMLSQYENLRYSSSLIPAYWDVELSDVINNREGEIVIMGTTGASGIKKQFLGSNAARVLLNSRIPVLVIPASASITKIQKIGFAYDGQPIEPIETLSILNDFRSSLQASLHVFQILQPNQSTSPFLPDLIRYLSNETYQDVDNTDIATAILTCIDVNHLDMLVMMPRHHGFFHSLINGSMTEKIVYEINIPLLAIPESKS